MIYHLIASDISEGEYDHAVSLSCDPECSRFQGAKPGVCGGVDDLEYSSDIDTIDVYLRRGNES